MHLLRLSYSPIPTTANFLSLTILPQPFPTSCTFTWPCWLLDELYTPSSMLNHDDKELSYWDTHHMSHITLHSLQVLLYHQL